MSKTPQALTEDQVFPKAKAVTDQRIALIQARWHADIVDQARVGLLEALPPGLQVDVIDVPGALEIPLTAQRLAQSGRYAAVIGAAFVVDGGIYRHDFVAGTVVDALVRVGLATDIPVLSVVLTPHQYQETEQHTGFFHDHFRIKGQEAAHACLTIIAPPVIKEMAA
ncbi:MAG: 6,7-dimethyl-8-ribityllumazine synthase [Pseudomonadota bacterium]